MSAGPGRPGWGCVGDHAAGTSGRQQGDHVRSWVRHKRLHSGTRCVLWGQGGGTGPCGGGGGEQRAASVAGSEENVGMSLFYCQAPPEAWAPPQPLHHTGCPESPCKAPGRGAQAAQRFMESPSAEAPHGGLRKASEGVCFLRGRDWQDGAVLLAWGPCAQQTGSVCGGGGHPGLACSARTPRCSLSLYFPEFLCAPTLLSQSSFSKCV